MVSEPKKALEVFFSYSHKDQDLRDQLETHLSLLKNQGFISSWHDRKIIAGTEWAREIDAHLNTAQIIMLLISADFLASTYCYDIEVKRAMERHNAGEARVIPIILRHCDWHHAPFGKLQALPTDGKPVDSRSWYNKDEAFHNIAQGIRKAVEDLQALKTSPKVGDDRSGDFSKTDEKLTLPKPKVNKGFNSYKVRDEWVEYITSNLKEAVEGEDSLDFYTNDAQGHRQIRILSNQKTVYSLDIHKGSMGGSRGDDGISFSYAEGRATFGSGFNASGNFKWDIQKEAIVLELLDTSLLSHLGGTKEYTKEEFLHALWDKIRVVIERSASW
ncbi:MAG: toll/interleukin-1 receptor domain-containing protein [Ktedonobacteraceae bacterium]